MTQEEKQLLLKDLCARLPYHIMAEYRGANVDLTQYARSVKIENCKPYLRPMSSMTDEEKAFLNATKEIEYTQTGLTGDGVLTLESYDYLNSIHVDYRGLIEKGLALEAPDGMYKTE